MDQAELIHRCLKGDETAQEEFIARFSPLLYRLARALLDDPVEASEAAQDALVSALMALPGYKGGSALSTWIYAIALNECRARLRRRRVREKLRQILGALIRVDGAVRANPEEDYLRSEESRKVWSAVQSLDERHRVPVILRYYQELTVLEIAGILRVKEGTVHSRLNAARARLHALLAEQGATRRETGVFGGLHEPY